MWNVKTKRPIRTLEGHGDGVSSAIFSPDGRYIATGSWDGITRIWDAKADTASELCSLVGLGEDSWIVTDPEGRFDTGKPEAIPGLHWIAPDDPSRTLDPEIFMRDYYEPRLLTKVLSGQALPPVRPLDELNRVQPAVAVARVAAAAGPDQAFVTVEVSSAQERFGCEGRSMRSDAFDLRLFRDGQLVSRWPEPAEGDDDTPEPDPTKPEQMVAWRDANRVPLDASGKASKTFVCALPRRPGGKSSSPPTRSTRTASRAPRPRPPSTRCPRMCRPPARKRTWWPSAWRAFSDPALGLVLRRRRRPAGRRGAGQGLE